MAPHPAAGHSHTDAGADADPRDAAPRARTPARPPRPQRSRAPNPSPDSHTKGQARTCEISSVVEIMVARPLSSATTASTARLMPRRRSIGLSPAATLLHPSTRIARASTVAVVVPAGARARMGV